MACRLFLVFNHKITKTQRQDARAHLGVEEFVEMPGHLKQLWNQVPPKLHSITAYLAPLKEWLNISAKEGDYVLIQGDFGATYLMVNFAFRRGLIPIYSTTTRKAQEVQQPDGTVTLSHVFSHCIFRRYESE